MDTYEHVLKQMTDYRAPTGMPEDWGLYPKDRVEQMSERLAKFDAEATNVTDDRGVSYGHPRPAFRNINRLKEVVSACPDPLARHALEMICVKMARLIETPDHLDSWIDIAGYARTGVMVTDK